MSRHPFRSLMAACSVLLLQGCTSSIPPDSAHVDEKVDDAPIAIDLPSAPIVVPEPAPIISPEKIVFVYPPSGGGGGSKHRRRCPSGVRDSEGRCIDDDGGNLPPPPDPVLGPPAGNPDPANLCTVPQEGELEDVSSPTTVVGTGTPASCTSAAVVAAVAGGGIITFDCGPDPITIVLNETAKIFNDQGPDIVIDGGGLVTLSGNNERRILYMNTCDEDQVFTTNHCDNQDHPRLTLQNITFIAGNSTSDVVNEGGGAVFARGGRLKVVNSRFFNNVCALTGPDVGGAGIRALDQFDDLPVFVVNSTFGGDEGFGNLCSNGGGISSIGVSWTIINSFFTHNRATGTGGNPPASGQPGGGSGGAIYNDGNTMTLDICGSRIQLNEVNAFGSAIFFISNDHTGNIVIDRSIITDNIGGSFYPVYPQISAFADTPIAVTDSTIEN